MNLKGRSFLTLKDFTAEEILGLIDLAADLKAKKKQGIPINYYTGKNIVLVKTKNVKIITDEPVDWTLDGEYCRTDGNVDISVMNEAVSVVTPKGKFLL